MAGVLNTGEVGGAPRGFVPRQGKTVPAGSSDYSSSCGNAGLAEKGRDAGTVKSDLVRFGANHKLAVRDSE